VSEPTVVVVEGEGQEQDGSDAAFAAGVAAATSAQAAETAEEAGQVAEQAQETADVAVEVAAGATEAAWSAQDAVAELRGEVFAALDEIRSGMAGRMDEPEEEVAPAPEAAPEPASEDTTEKSHGDEKPAEKKYGARRWFG
jgi:hypothetical protein